MRSQSKLQPVSPDAIYNLLPQVIRSNDPNGAIASYMSAQASEHNFFLQKMSELPVLHDPRLVGQFDPAGFNESTSDFDLYVEESKKDRSKMTVSELRDHDTLLVQLEERVPHSVRAYKLQNRLLGLLASTVGARIYNKYYVASNRQLIETAIARHHIKGTHSSVRILGRILGFIDLKVRELWSRFTIRDPGEPGNALNEFDFADVPEQFPYWPISEQYDGNINRFTERGDATSPDVVNPTDEVAQFPPPNPAYDPTKLDDRLDNNGEKLLYEVKFEGLKPDKLSGRYYLDLINNHNPFGNFSNDILDLLKPGTYYLHGGNDIKLAKTVIPYAAKSAVRAVRAIRGEDDLLLVTVDKGNENFLLGSLVYLGEAGFDDFFTIKTILEVGNRVELGFDYPKAVVPSSGSLGHLIYSELGFVIFEALAFGDWANSVELRVNPDVGGAQIVRLIGPQSKIKFKSSYFDLILSGDISLFPTLYPSKDVEPCFDGSLDDLIVEPTTVFTITSVDTDYVSTRFPRLTLDVPGGDYADGTVGGITPGTLVKIDGLAFTRSNEELRRVIEVDAVNNALVIEGPPGAPTEAIPIFEYAGNTGTVSGTLTFGRVAGELPVTGSLGGTRQIAAPNTKVVDFVSFSELLATLRELFEELRPLTRTQRLSRAGFLLKDQMLYAPYYIKDHVVLQSDDGYNYRLRVDRDKRVWWEEVDSDLIPTPIVQRMVQTTSDPRLAVIISLDYVAWKIRRVNGLPEFYVDQTAGVAQSDIVFVTDGVTEAVTPGGDIVTDDGLSPTTTILYEPRKFTGFQGYVVVENNRLVAYTELPDQLRSIHGDGTTDETGELATDKHLYAENPDNQALSDSLSDDGHTSDKPRATFRFNERPEDDLDFQYGVGDAIRTFLTSRWYSSLTKDDYSFVDEAWSYQFADGAFNGRDLRNRSAGVLPHAAEPSPSDVSFYLGYPIRFITLSGKVVWRERDITTNAPHTSVYFLGDVNLDNNDPPALNEMPTRLDYIDGSITYDMDTATPIHNTEVVTADGQIESQESVRDNEDISVLGSGVTPNNQSWGTLDRIWQSRVSRDFESPTTFTSVNNASGKAQLVMGLRHGLSVGMKIRIASGAYAGVATILNIQSSNQTSLVTINMSYTATSSSAIACRMVEMQMWETPRDLKLTLRSGASATEELVYAVYGSDYDGSNEVLLDSGSVVATGTGVLHLTGIESQLVYVELSSVAEGQLADVALEREVIDLPLIRNPFALGRKVWRDGRDALEVTIMDDGDHFWSGGLGNHFTDTSKSEISETYTQVTYDPGSSLAVPSWRGGDWGLGARSWTIIERGTLPSLLVRGN
jgi:hypothetical protein